MLLLERWYIVELISVFLDDVLQMREELFHFQKNVQIRTEPTLHHSLMSILNTAFVSMLVNFANRIGSKTLEKTFSRIQQLSRPIFSIFPRGG